MIIKFPASERPAALRHLYLAQESGPRSIIARLSAASRRPAPPTPAGQSSARHRVADVSAGHQIADQRLGRASLTRGNVGGSHTTANDTAETALYGCANGRARPHAPRFAPRRSGPVLATTNQFLLTVPR